ncbi:ribonuclease [Listeria floridensis FSL S10-1187]|uniref:Ribonuclease n=1 Tax=Listeria floridensis FSL S10-1187 TaxID=1265817 RepID=A0ABP3B058_9LIST|nr:ribonuclease E/G [Listeria floridensis]EUJ33241.1 ribonuclease [Listeria floridensis FSL S10-1187]
MLDQANLVAEQIVRLKRHYGVSEVVADMSLSEADRVILNRDLFQEFGIDGEVGKLTQPIVYLENGVTLYIEKTEAMWVVDVNSSSFSGNFDKAETVFRVNQSVLKEILRQIRLRQMSGLIVIDFIGGMKDAGQEELLLEMEQLIKQEQLTTQIAEFSKSGLMQLTRKKKNSFSA